jgi:hypothetical protein
MKKGNEIVSLIGRAMTSTDLRPSDLSQIMDWSSGKWNLEDRSDYNGQDFLDILVDRLVKKEMDGLNVKSYSRGWPTYKAAVDRKNSEVA